MGKPVSTRAVYCRETEIGIKGGKRHLDVKGHVAALQQRSKKISSQEKVTMLSQCQQNESMASSSPRSFNGTGRKSNETKNI